MYGKEKIKGQPQAQKCKDLAVIRCIIQEEVVIIIHQEVLMEEIPHMEGIVHIVDHHMVVLLIVVEEMMIN